MKPIHCQVVTGAPDEPVRMQIFDLYAAVFGTERQTELSQKWGERMQANSLTILARVAGEPAGFKAGYALDDRVFYSWLGGVLPEFRRTGIGQMLLDYQHRWCREQSFRIIRTHTLNQWKNMLLLNLRNGFDIAGTFTDERQTLKIILEKKLYP